MESPSLASRSLSLVFVGPAAVGKMRLVLQSVGKALSDGDTQQMFVASEKILPVDGVDTRVMLCDTQDGADYAEQRDRVCKIADVIFLCYSVIQPQTLDQVQTVWASALAKYNRPIILLGTKTDMRDNAELRERLSRKQLVPVTREQGQKVAQQMGALSFYEVSCEEHQDPLASVFTEVLELVFGTPKPGQQRDKKKKVRNENCAVM